jgi:hypothetical protein
MGRRELCMRNSWILSVYAFVVTIIMHWEYLVFVGGSSRLLFRYPHEACFGGVGRGKDLTRNGGID